MDTLSMIFQIGECIGSCGVQLMNKHNGHPLDQNQSLNQEDELTGWKGGDVDKREEEIGDDDLDKFHYNK